jgi:hypothetical protein
LIALITVDLPDLDAGSRIAFTALTGLGVVMAYRLIRSRREASAQPEGWQERYIDHVYFTYISLWEGFVILPALNLPLPQVSVPVVTIGVLLIGHALIARYKTRVLTRRARGWIRSEEPAHQGWNQVEGGRGMTEELRTEDSSSSTRPIQGVVDRPRLRDRPGTIVLLVDLDEDSEPLDVA